jgi:signal transduction histidine kinase
VARRVAEAHGGHIGAYNLANGGAVVWFVIPLRSTL